MLPAVMAYDRDSDPDSKDPINPKSTDAGANGESRNDQVQEHGSTEDGEAKSESTGEPRSDSERSAVKANQEDTSPAKSQRRRPSSAKSRRASDDDDYDDEDEDDEDDEEYEERRPVRRARPKRRSLKPRLPRRKLDVPTSEEELNIPKMQTIGMLGSISLLMIIMWFAARLACNAHPDQIRDPRYVSVDQLARDPKNAALEFQLRYVSRDFLLAGEIASGKVAEKIHELLTACESDPERCDKDRLAMKDKVTGTATLLDVTPARATVEVTTFVSNENPQTVTLDVVSSGLVWKVTQSREGSIRKSDAGSAEPEITQAPPPVQ